MNDLPAEQRDQTFESQLDRLACGELDEAARGRLVAWLEADPPRWRLCGLAFLEAQAWSLAFGNWKAGPPEGFVQPLVGRRAGQRAGTRRAVAMRRVAIAAGVLVAFLLGAALRDVIRPGSGEPGTSVAEATGPDDTEKSPDRGNARIPAKEEPLLASVSVRTGPGGPAPASISIPVVPAKVPAAGAAPASSEIPEYVLRYWERRGYNVSLERRYLMARLPDGKQVVVPVEQVQLKPLPVVVN